MMANQFLKHNVVSEKVVAKLVVFAAMRELDQYRHLFKLTLDERDTSRAHLKHREVDMMMFCSKDDDTR